MCTRFKFPLVLFLLTLFGIFTFHFPYLSGKKLYFHDSLIAMTDLYVFWDSLFLGQLPLWDPYTQGGQPLWPLAELSASWDPFTFFFFLVAKVFHLNVHVTYSWLCVTWLGCFSLGACLWFKQCFGSRFLSALVFIVLFMGPLALSLPGQSHGFLIAFRYTPWVLLLLIPSIRTPTPFRGCCLGAFLGLSLGGYQSLYSLLFIFLFVVGLGAFKREIFKAASVRTWAVFLLSLSLTALPFFLPVLVVGLKLLELYPALRTFPETPYHLSLALYVSSIFYKGVYFLTPSGGNDWKSMRLVHGSGYISTLLGGALWVGIYVSVVKAWNKTWEGVEKIWAMLLLFATVLVFGLLNLDSFIGLRNWGFAFPLFLLMSFVFLHFAIQFEYSRKKLLGYLLFAGVLSLTLHFWLDVLYWPLPWSYFFLVALMPLAFLWLCQKHDFWRFCFFLLILVDLSRFTRRNTTELLAPVGEGLYFHSSPAPFPETVGLWKKEGLIEGYKYHYGTLFREPLLFAPDLDLPYFGGVLPFTHAYHTHDYEAFESSDAAKLLKAQLQMAPMAFLSFSPPSNLQSRGSWKEVWELKQYRPNHLVLLNKQKASGRLQFFSGVSDADWKVEVDGRPRRLEKDSPMERGLPLSKEDSLITLSYKPWPYLLAFWFRAVGTLVCLILFLKAPSSYKTTTFELKIK